MKKSLLYVLNSRMPSEKGYGIQTVNSCNALSDFYEVDLCYQQRSKNIGFDEFYGIDCSRFKKIPIFTGELKFFYKVSQFFWFLCLQFIFYFRFLIFIDFKKYNVIFTRDENCILIFELIKRAGFLKKTKVCFEAHNFKPKYGFLKKIDNIITMTSYIGEKFDSFRKQIVVLHDAVDYDLFDKTIINKSIKKSLNIDKNKKIMMFIGKTIIYEFEKGIFSIIDAVSDIENVVFVCIGGPEYMFHKYREHIAVNNYDTKQFIFIPHVKYSEIPDYMNSADILISYTPDKEVFSKYVSPLKIFEYLATGIPVILSDLKTHREILESYDNSVFFVKPDCITDLRKIILTITENYNNVKNISIKNKAVAQNYTWKKRAEKIHKFIERI